MNLFFLAKTKIFEQRRRRKHRSEVESEKVKDHFETFNLQLEFLFRIVVGRERNRKLRRLFRYRGAKSEQDRFLEEEGRKAEAEARRPLLRNGQIGG